MALPPLNVVTRSFWDLVVGGGVSASAAGVAVGASANSGMRWFRNAGGVKPLLPEPKSCGSRSRLTFSEREEIAVGVAAKESIRSIARRLGRHPSTIMREIDNNGGGRGRYRSTHRFGARRGGWEARPPYRASLAQARCEARARRPKPRKLVLNDALGQTVQDRLHAKHSPAQISGALRLEHPDRPEMQVSHETIYKALYLQGRGGLRRELVSCLRTGRAIRQPNRSLERRSNRTRIPGMVNISQRPAEAADRAVPGHWEGDLILGKDNASAIGTLVERRSGFLMLLHLPHDHTAESVADAAVATMSTLPGFLRRTLTWDQGSEMAQHARIAMATGLDIYFCDPHSPWQRGSNENTNGLLRQYFPKGTDLSIFPADYLDYVAAQLNTRPRKRHGYRTPAHILNDILTESTTVASIT
ncbi:Transposase and inactivated derivatives, IS30 family [Nocardia amikacinitolerans]|uniref:IS30 family transposase n=1 Tax=Nocardia amikacinitolerans TaxID=756689 RepID=UPI0020A5B7BA|nr:IS30 family transposase [Nocardia amikacinitolerans]MCP2295199.1 Transposase and inactivated derivatives, IS30 family [Nocardia amikacinitolerans]